VPRTNHTRRDCSNDDETLAAIAIETVTARYASRAFATHCFCFPGGPPIVLHGGLVCAAPCSEPPPVVVGVERASDGGRGYALGTDTRREPVDAGDGRTRHDRVGLGLALVA
jgi:hypothetical protein